MKKVWQVWVCCVLMVTSGTAQDRVRESVLMLRNSAGELVNDNRTVYRYQGEHFEARETYRWDENDWKLKSRDLYWLNPAGMITRHISRIYNEDFSRILLESVLEKEYLADTLETSSEFVRKVFEEDISEFRSEFRRTYTPEGLPATVFSRFRESVDGPWNGGETRYEYDQNQCQSQIVYTRLSGDDLIPYRKVRIEHDERCRITRETSFRIENGQEYEGRATLITYSDSPDLVQRVQFTRDNPSSAWQFDQELEIRQSGDSTIETFVNNEITFVIRRIKVLVNDLLVRETAEVAFDDQDDFRLTNKSVNTYEEGLLIQTQWEERSGNEANILTAQGSLTYTYNTDGNITLYENTSIRDGIPSSTYRQTMSYRCDGLLETVEDNFSKTKNSYYSDASCDGSDYSITMTLYPNPATNELWIYTQENIEEARVEIIDSSGRRIDAMIMDGPNYEYLDISALTPGTYLVRVQGEGFDSTLRFIKQQ